MLINMKEWLITAYEIGDLTREDLRGALVDFDLAKELWLRLCYTDDYVEQCQEEIEEFLELMDGAD